jgi:hypothetical protein
VEMAQNKDTSVLSIDNEISELYEFFATQRRKKSDKDSCVDGDTETEASDEEVAHKVKDAVTLVHVNSGSSPDDDICLSQALLQKLEESFSASSQARKIDPAIDKFSEDAVSEPGAVCSSASMDSDSTRDDRQKDDSDIDCVLEVNQNYDPCDGCYDRVSIEGERSGEAGKEDDMGVVTLQSTYSAASPLSVLDDDSCDMTDSTCGNAPSNFHQTLMSRDRQADITCMAEGAPSKRLETNERLFQCSSPDDLFESPSSVSSSRLAVTTHSGSRTEIEAPTVSRPKCRRSLNCPLSRFSVETESCDKDQLYSGSREVSDLGIDDCSVGAAPTVLDELTHADSEFVYRSSRRIRAKTRNCFAEASNGTCNETSCSSGVEHRDSFSKSGRTQWHDVEPDSDSECTEPEMQQQRIAEVGEPVPVAEISPCNENSEIVVIEDDDSDKCENVESDSRLIVQKGVPRAEGIVITDIEAEDFDDPAYVLSPVIDDPQCLGQVRSSRSMTNDSTCDVWEGFDEANAAAVYMPDLGDLSGPHQVLNN